MKIGCHISIRKGYYEAARTAVHLGAGSFQYFPKNPRGLSVKAFDRGDAERCAAFCREHRLLSIAHTPYPTNLAVDEGELRRRTFASLRNDLEIAEACGSVGIVVHFGKYKGDDTLQGYKNIIQCINEVLADHRGEAMLLLENQAGEGTAMGTTLEELVQVRSLCERPERVGFCFDTCHAYASGLWPGRGEGWPELERRARAAGYWELLRAVHLNDSVYPRGMRKDRHAMIGQGHIGEEGFIPMLRALEQRELPVVLETPVPQGRTHAEEIHYVKELICP